MQKRLVVCAMVVLAFCFVVSGLSFAEETKATGQTAKSFWQKLFNYPANVTNETAGVIADAATGATKVVTKEVKTVGQVTSGEGDKVKNLVTDPVVGTAEVTKKAAEGTVAIPGKANKDE